MSGNYAHGLLQSSLWTAHDERQCQHSPGKELDWDLQDDEMRLLAAVVLGESVDEC